MSKVKEAIQASREIGEVLNELGYTPTQVSSLSEAAAIQASLQTRAAGGIGWDEAFIEAVHDTVDKAIAGAGAL